MLIDPVVLRASALRGDSVYPYATFMPIREAETQPRIDVRMLLFHSQAGPKLTKLEALWRYVDRDDIHIEPTFILDLDGRMAQLVGEATRAAGNYKANPFAASVETQDHGWATLAHTPWSADQIDQLAGLAAWYSLRDGVPLISPARWDGAGIGHHSQYPEWSKYTGKTCPGSARIAQMPEILARARALIAAPIPHTPIHPAPAGIEEDDMPVYRYKDRRYANEFMFPTGLTYPGELVVDEGAVAGVPKGPMADLPLTVGQNDPVLEALCRQNWGVDVATAITRGFLVPG